MISLIFIFVNFLLLLQWTTIGQNVADMEKDVYQFKVENWLENIDENLSKFNSLAAHITWKLSTNPDEKTLIQANELAIVRNKWHNRVCESNVKINWITNNQKRKLYLLCRGPKFNNDEIVLNHLKILGKMAQEYNSQVCLPYLQDTEFQIINNSTNYPKPGDCLYGEPDLETQMKRIDELNPSQLKWIWNSWHDSVGPRIKNYYQIAINNQNLAARSNGYQNMGQVWQEELEIPNLEDFSFKLYAEIEPLYIMLHAVIRHKLYNKYGPSVIKEIGPLPIHLLGNMWGQEWSSLIKEIFNKKIDFDKRIKEKHIGIRGMVYEAEDFYTSLGLPKMTRTFWKNSIFEENENLTLCHGTAANLYTKGDYRMMMCAKPTMSDFYIIHHEMGHIQYYMAYEDQPPIYQDGTNAAFHESIGDAIMHGVMTPQHLHRLRLLTDDEVSDKNIELYLLFQQALMKIPEISFALVVDKYRWELFKGTIPYDKWNNYYWELTRKYRGIEPPNNESRDEPFLFDAGGKFHISDNTPFIRYFLSNFINMQIFKSLCEITMYGKIVESNNFLPLQRCDIYGTKNAGKKLKEMMEKGSSIHWSKALAILTGQEKISTKPLLDYYRPVIVWLENYIEQNNVPMGW